ncbi:MAG: hypothetical protein M9949_12100 [Candidatus Kapabacteria bacterium]|nr:hypothetical protein [Candidatus Kapabacteria bacterium]
MKTTVFFIALIVALTALSLNAQECIVVQEGEDITVYYTTCLDQAINEASPDAVVYLSGGVFSFCNSATVIDKKLQFIGAGYNPMGVVATEPTSISNTIKVVAGGDGTAFIGMKFAILNGAADDIVVWRCYFTKIESDANIDGWMIDECIFNEISGTATKKLTNFSISRCISTFVTGSQTFYTFRHLNNSIINNCLFLNSVTSRLDNSHNNNLSNNLFHLQSYFFNTSNSNRTYNNLLTTYTQISSTDNVDANSLTNENIHNHLEMHAQNSNHSFTADYHLKDDSAGKDYGTDDTDIGIYGTILPFKDDAVPFNPHIEQAILANKSVNGGIQVKIKVRAQER